MNCGVILCPHWFGVGYLAIRGMVSTTQTQRGSNRQLKRLGHILCIDGLIYLGFRGPEFGRALPLVSLPFRMDWLPMSLLRLTQWVLAVWLRCFVVSHGRYFGCASITMIKSLLVRLLSRLHQFCLSL